MDPARLTFAPSHTHWDNKHDGVEPVRLYLKNLKNYLWVKTNMLSYLKLWRTEIILWATLPNTLSWEATKGDEREVTWRKSCMQRQMCPTECVARKFKIAWDRAEDASARKNKIVWAPIRTSYIYLIGPRLQYSQDSLPKIQIRPINAVQRLQENRKTRLQICSAPI